MRPTEPHTHAAGLITAVLRDPSVVVRLPGDDLDLALRVLRRARLLGRVATDLRVLGLLESLPAVALDQLVSAEVAATSRQRAIRWELDRLAWALRDLEADVIALKGAAYLLAQTPNARGRPSTDVDLLVAEGTLGAVERHLGLHGWHAKPLNAYDEHYYRAWAHELPPLVHEERAVEVDLHHSLLMRTARLRPSSARLLEAARVVPGSRFRVLAPPDMVLHAMTHLFYGGEMDDALRELVDLRDLLEHFAALDPGFWETLVERAAILDLGVPAFHALRQVSRLLGVAVPGSVLASLPAPRAPLVRYLDRLFPLALFPRHPDFRDRAAAWARFQLYVRSHWVKMPARMLATHLSRKAWRRMRV